VIARQDASFDDINSHRVAVGSSFSGDTQHAYVYRNGAVTRLKAARPRPSRSTRPVSSWAPWNPATGGLPARWSPAGAAPTKLPVPAGVVTGETAGIAEDGTIVGTVAPAHAGDTGYLWPPGGKGGQMPDLNPPAIGAENGWVLGTALDAPAVVAGRKVVRLPPYQKHRMYKVSSFSADGRTGGWRPVTAMTAAPARR
jgi:hypothetical protein